MNMGVSEHGENQPNGHLIGTTMMNHGLLGYFSDKSHCIYFHTTSDYDPNEPR
jgi:hypothetical protein